MKLADHAKSLRSMALAFPDGMVRPAAEVFVFADGSGIAFADLGWNDPLFSGHPFHLIKGEITGEGPWLIGNVKLYEIDGQDDLATAFRHWEREIQDRDKRELRERCKSSIESEFGVLLIP